MTLRSRIILLATGLTALVLVLFAVPLAIALKQSASDRVIRESEYVTQGVADYLSTNTYTTTQTKQYVERVNSRTDTSVAVLLPDGQTIGAKLPSDVPKAPGGDPDHDGDRDGDHDDLGKVTAPRVQRAADGWIVDIQSSNASGRALVRGYVGDAAVDREVAQRWAIVGGAAIALLAIAALGAEIVSRRLTRPLVATAATASELSAGRLDARAPVSGAHEIAEVATALNQLADRIEELLESERETIADLSHRLRTPMTAIRLDVEALPESERATELARHVAVLERTLTEVIRHARLPQQERSARSCDAREVLLDRVAFWTPLAEDQDREVVVEEPGVPVLVGCTADELSSALDALIENVIAHTPEGSAFGVSLVATSDGGQIDVTDHGPGIPLGATRRGRSDRGSSGLGLDIARNCAESTGGHLDIVSNDDGTHVVRLVLQAPHSDI
jgi:signal transduction histidine kinase